MSSEGWSFTQISVGTCLEGFTHERRIRIPGKPKKLRTCRPAAYTHASNNAVLLQKDSGWSLLCREEGTWFLAGHRTLSNGCLRPRAFSPMQTHGLWISHVTQGAYLEDQLTWDWGPEGEETETCPPHAEHGGEQGSVRLQEFLVILRPWQDFQWAELGLPLTWPPPLSSLWPKAKIQSRWCVVALADGGACDW